MTNASLNTISSGNTVSAETVGVIDLGSNSIKALVARVEGGDIRPIFSSTRETRIGSGLSQNPVRLDENSMKEAVESVKSLLEDMKAYAPQKLQIVATSAVREAVNGPILAGMVQEATGLSLSILTGEEEACGIASGVASDPLIRPLPCVSAFDLGGGSLECIRIEGGLVKKAISLPLGSVRLTERYVPDPSLPFSDESIAQIQQAVERTLSTSGFPLTPGPMAGTSGAFSISRSILSHRLGRSFGEVSPVLKIAFLRSLFNEMAMLSKEDRMKIPRLPPSRADIFPTALLTVVTIADMIGAEEVFHSQRNLRFGLAAQLAKALQ